MNFGQIQKRICPPSRRRTMLRHGLLGVKGLNLLKRIFDANENKQTQRQHEEKCDEERQKQRRPMRFKLSSLKAFKPRKKQGRQHRPHRNRKDQWRSDIDKENRYCGSKNISTHVGRDSS